MNSFGCEFWNDIYSLNEYVYGTDPNVFFKKELEKLTPGKILMLGEGEGRNAIYAAKRGWEVDAVDFSTVARERAIMLAKKNNVSIKYEVSDLSEFNFKQNNYDAVANIFLHLNLSSRKIVFYKSINSLKVGGTFILKVFDKDQLGRNSGGPQNLEMLYSAEELKDDFKSMQIQLLEKKLITLGEGDYHEGEASVIRLKAVKK